ncbi:hypothetical protein CRG98_011686 [Punica granatum]|uniref:CCHC-type domain-containing protein n=1 Tax=Punica granatum TaxID=22663 RepID=A0A2I0KIF0_PUNGR|nr:hypothetical protein CRG98_011686 [Punica granatum]
MKRGRGWSLGREKPSRHPLSSLPEEKQNTDDLGLKSCRALGEGKVTCSHCGKPGHTKGMCWAIIGYPAWHFKSKAGAGKGPRTGQAKQNAGLRGKAQTQRGPDQVNAAQTVQGASSRAERLEALPDEHFQRLLSMLSQDVVDPNLLVGNKFNLVTLQNEWILDTGASRHMTGCLEYFLISIPIKGGAPDRTSRRTLGLGELRGGVYYLKQVATAPQKCQMSCTNTSQQNGQVERKHRHILNVARALMFQASLPTKFWGEYISMAVHLINITPTPLLDNKSSHEITLRSEWAAVREEKIGQPRKKFLIWAKLRGLLGQFWKQ